MVVSVLDILVMTPVRSFGELLQQALQETDLYRVTLVPDKPGVLSALRSETIPVVVLDLDLDSEPADLLAAVDEINPNAALIVLRNKTEGWVGLPSECRVARLLEGSFYLPDLFEALESVSADLDLSAPTVVPGLHSPAPPPVGSPAPAWLQSPEQSANRLSAVPLGDSVQAAIIMSQGQLQDFAGGDLPMIVGEELAQILHNYWVPEGSRDLARYIHLDATGREHLLYATRLGADSVLGLILPDDTLFSKTRLQAKELCQRLNGPLEGQQTPTQ
jgi:hypothetical protein